MQFKAQVSHVADMVTYWVGSIPAIVIATLSLLVFFVGGLMYDFTDTYQLIGNTFMSAISYLMLFVIQHTQNHDAKAQQIKLDELIFHLRETDNSFIGIQNLTEEELEALSLRFEKIARSCRSSTK